RGHRSIRRRLVAPLQRARCEAPAFQRPVESRSIPRRRSNRSRQGARLGARGGAAAAGVPMKTVAIVQSNYIPWKGYFDLINSADDFILFDDVQYTRRDWRNRNLIKTPRGLEWLTIPVAVKGQYRQKICDTQVSEPGWGAQHWASLAHNYA